MKRAILFSVAALLLLYLVRELEYAGLRRNRAGEFSKLREAYLEPHPCDLLIIGSSRAECQFYSPIIDSATGLRTFNIGMTGATMPFIRTSLEAYLENSPPPKYVILNLDLHSFKDNPDTVYKFPRYFAYLSNEKLRKGLEETDPRFYWFRKLAFYSMPYYGTKYLDASLRGWLDKPGKYDSTYSSGFAPSERNPALGNLDTLTIAPYVSDPQPYVKDNLDRIVSICREKNIRLIIVLSPLFHRWEESVINYPALCEQFRNYARSKNAGFLDLGLDPVRNDQSLYSDPAHLSLEGARLFSSHFSDTLAQYIRP
jgi:hypothetical protein